MRINKKKLAFCSPLPPAPSGIAQWSGRILPILAAGFEITVFTDTTDPVPPLDVSAGYSVESLKRFPLDPSSKDFDLVLYQIGSNKLHAGIYLSAVLRPGIVMLHESVLHHLVKATTVGIGENAAYTDEMTRYYGKEGAEIARLVHTGRAATETLFFHYPFFNRITERSRAIITTTETSKTVISTEYPTKRIHFSPICGCMETSEADREAARKALSVGDEFIIGIFGLISHAKKTNLVLDVFSRLQRKYSNIKLLLAGGVDPYYDLDKDITTYKIDDGIIRTGRLSDYDYSRWLAAADICINLRYPIGGESSSTLIEMMDAGKAVILPAAGQFLEIPQDCAIHIPLGRDSLGCLAAAIEEYMAKPEVLEAIGKRAKAFSTVHFSLERSGSSLIKTLEEITVSDLPEPAPLDAEEKTRFERLYHHFVTNNNEGSDK
jgi:glycosyltransferase involved in cell wall biosynthesis